ncbi:RDD family protein [Clostridium butyricum]|uniref:RDD family protein n=1 Tax=Clostridium butyricum TaxID=1492 RepID=UPI001CA7C767|nr:RDD family protein [Clostridium butyricum]MBZ0312748.1 RDD family protein [Clostridium butyricum]
MEKDNVKENETEVNTDEKEEYSVELSKEHEENTNNELQDLIEDHEEEVDSKESNKPSFGKEIFANLLDQFVILAGSSVILLIADVVMRMFGYQFVRETGILVAVVMCVYFVINCFYVQLMERTKLKNTIAKKILNL